MKTVKFARKSLRRFGIATASATALSLSLLASVTASAQQSLGHSILIPAAARQGNSVKPLIPYAPGEKFPASQHSRPASLAPIVVAKHPITGYVKLAQSLDLSGPGVALQGHIPPIATRSLKIGPMDQTQPLTVTFALKPRNQAEMDKLAKRLYDPKDPMFGHYLKPAERIARFSPTQEDFNKVVAFAQQKGLRVTDSSVDRQMVMATGTVGQIETALNTHLSRFKAAGGREFYAPESAPVVPAAIAPLILSINRLTDADIPRSGGIPRPSSAGGSVPGGGSGGADPLDIGIWSLPGMPAGEVTYCYQLAYHTSSGTQILGQGQRVALVELGGFDQNDINYYIWYNANIALPSTNLNYIPIQTHLMAGFGGQTNKDTIEVELDIEMLEAIASGLDGVDVYEEDTNGDISQELNQIMSDDVANQVSISYDSSEDSTSASSEQVIVFYTEEMALQGQAVFTASGDKGAYDGTSQPTVNIYAASQYVTGVGGTSLWINEFSNYGAFWYEYPWNNSAGATGGGISANLTIPDYQLNYLINDPNASGSPASLTNRNVPDVALDADPYDGYYTHINGVDQSAGGTSAAAPIWAAFWAQANQFRALNGIAPLGFANPALYQVGLGSNYNSDFHDVYGGGNGVFSAVVGYDCTTGLGSIDGFNMINDLVNYGAWAPTESLSIAQSVVTSGQQISLNVNLETPVPSQDHATVTYAILSGGVLYQVGQDHLTPPASSDSFNVTAPDVNNSITGSYICYVTYYNANGKVLGGNDWSNYASVQVNPNELQQVTIAPIVVYDGQSATGTVSLLAPAAQNELIDLYSGNPANASVPATVTVPAGASSVNFTISTKPVAAAEQISVTAVPDAASGLFFYVPPAGTFTIAPLMSAFSIAPISVVGGAGAKGSITFAKAASAGFTLHLSSSNPSATVAATFKVPAGAASVTFPIGTKAVSANVTVTLTVNDGNASRTATLKVLVPTLKSLGISPGKVVGPATAAGIASLTGTAPKGGLTLGIESSNPAVASVPSSVIVAQGSTSATFPIKAAKVAKATKVEIKVIDPSGTPKTNTLTVNP